ncbi:MAG: hypothetical protein UY81_C0027G0007 [Candidatus Giovannonibacteria bacterium GW2011_GWA2_53_7]|uniref:Transcriptional regulator n=1 Tax=Candidatus Giovannonibacteria bacterium GW2011_GWA2_53_7 TaxID=1618650 RepID=A0A0G1XZN1_9BACT|nr:MAG: hypothetical protein UY81_C0027G0007 [Candidatus Giovannonibacteria bacterium GW2011_GWA2_53_7]
MTDILGKLFGSPARVKLMRLFLMNPEDIFDTPEIVKRSKVGVVLTRKELRLLLEIGLIKEKSFIKLHPRKNGNGKPEEFEKKKASGYVLDVQFPFLASLRSLATEIAIGKDDVAARFKNVGQIKLLIIAGIFLDEPDSRADILIVGDKLKRTLIENLLRRLEAELGKELTYGILETAEFEYRYGIYDKFIRDVIDYPHQIVVNKLNILQK